MTQPIITFIGAGNIAGSLIDGLLKHGHHAEKLRASAHSDSTCMRVQTQYGIQCCSDNHVACSAADVIVLAVKPQLMRDVCLQLSSALDHQPLIISVAAGITSDQINQWLGGNRAIVRCMPNTPAQLHVGASGLFANEHVSAQQKLLAEQLLSAVGITQWVASDDLMNSVTAVAGSGPAYYFLMMEIMEKVAVELGLSAEAAHQFTIQTALGAAKMASQGEFKPAELRCRVTSKNGTTDRAITTFLNEGMEAIIRKGMTGARDRGREMAQELC